MEDRLYRFAVRHELLFPPDRAVLGLSGGVDSVVLFHLLRLHEVALHAVHVNYQLRPEADADEQFVRDLCARYDVPVTVRQCPIDADVRREGRSIQDLARDVRYDIFLETAREHGFSRVAVGHQMDDQIETILLQLVRGTGLRGLAGMPARRPVQRSADVELIRPLLFARRSTVETYARERGWAWRTDASNASTDYLRTALRTKVLPRLEEQVGEGRMENIARTGAIVRGYLEQEWKPRLERDLGRCVDRRSDGTIAVDLEPLREVSRIWRQEVLLEIVRRCVPGAPVSTAVAEELADLADAQVGRRREYGEHTVWRERSRLIVVPASAGEPVIDRSIKPGQTIRLPGVGRLSLEYVEGGSEPTFEGDERTALIDARRVELPLRVRPWREGDRLQPLGMDGHKKVSDLLTDEKIPVHARDRVYVVTSRGMVIWVAGVRLADSVRITAGTDRMLKMTLEPISSGSSAE